MLIKLTGGKVYDPANGVDGDVRDIYVRDGRIVAAAAQRAQSIEEYDAAAAASSWPAASTCTRTSAAAR